jgi:propane monooxygenase reductase component
MSDKIHRVRFEPVDVEMDVIEGETVLNAAFRQGIALMHGCKEGQCSSCKSLLLEGDIELLKYSTFALPDHEKDTDHILLCRTLAYSDIAVELLNYDEDAMRRTIPVRDFGAALIQVTPLTHDIRLLEIELDEPLRFWAGQYVDLTISGTGITRSFSMANTPKQQTRLSFIIKRYPQGLFSGLLDGGLRVGQRLTVKGPYGTCFRREDRTGPMLLIGGGSGMSPLWSILCDQLESGEKRPIRFFYGARTRRDLFYLEEFAALTARLPNFRFIPALSHAEPEDAWTAETGFIHDVVDRTLRAEELDGEMDVYSCGPPSMIDAVVPILQMSKIQFERIYIEKFTRAVH